MVMGNYGVVTARTANLFKSYKHDSEIETTANQGERLALHGKVDKMQLVCKLSDNALGWMYVGEFKITPLPKPTQPLHQHVP